MTASNHQTELRPHSIYFVHPQCRKVTRPMDLSGEKLSKLSFAGYAAARSTELSSKITENAIFFSQII